LRSGWPGQPALRNAFIELHGDLGAGKTTLVRHLLRALGVQGRVKSPTYAVVEPHEVPGLAIWHFDFYRFTDPREWEDAGFRDVFASPGLKLAEWPQNAAPVLPLADLVIRMEVLADDARTAVLTAQTATGRSLAERRNGMTAPTTNAATLAAPVLQAGTLVLLLGARTLRAAPPSWRCASGRRPTIHA
jgi:tRNA threonylcarbamoyladenosine biosynthesis protein TsaE